MKLHPPFSISARLLPALTVGTGDSRGTISLDTDGTFWIDLAGGYEHHVTDFRPGLGARDDVASMFADLLSFLIHCADSYVEWLTIKVKTGVSEDVDGADLFPPPVARWAARCRDEIESLQYEIEESESQLIES